MSIFGRKKAQMHVLDERKEAKSEAMRWLIEMELVTNPNLVNSMVLNVFRVSNRVKDTQILIDSTRKRILVWLELDWWGKKFRQDLVKQQVEAMLAEVLPSFKFRVIYDKELFQKALKMVEASTRGVRNDKKDNKGVPDDGQTKV